MESLNNNPSSKDTVGAKRNDYWLKTTNIWGEGRASSLHTPPLEPVVQPQSCPKPMTQLKSQLEWDQSKGHDIDLAYPINSDFTTAETTLDPGL